MTTSERELTTIQRRLDLLERSARRWRLASRALLGLVLLVPAVVWSLQTPVSFRTEKEIAPKPLNANFSAAFRELTRLANQLNALNSRLDGLEPQVGGIGSAVSALQSQVSGLNGQMATVQGQISQLSAGGPVSGGELVAGAVTVSSTAYYPPSSSDYVNQWNGTVNFTCPENMVLIGVYSIHDNGNEDRRFRYRCASLQASTAQQ